jgi:acyl-CoA hydrolase
MIGDFLTPEPGGLDCTVNRRPARRPRARRRRFDRAARPCYRKRTMKKRGPRPGTVAATRVETAQVVLPGHTNAMGTLFGGMLMQWIDVAAAIAAARHARGPVVTASMDRLHFLRPIRAEEFVIIRAEVSYTGHTSMEVEVEAWAENPWTGERATATHALLTFVSLDEQGRPRAVPPLVTETAFERKRFAEAARRRRARLRDRPDLRPRPGRRRR